MGTRIDVVLQGQSKSRSDRAFMAVKSEFSRLDALMNRFDENSQVSMLNRLAGSRAVSPDPELFSILTQCRRYHELTDGLFDVSLGKMNDNAPSIQKSTRETSLMLENAGMEKIRLDEEEMSVRFAGKDVLLDLGGFGKGYGMDSIKSILQSSGISHAFISFGDSSVMALGDHPAGSGWKAGIMNVLEQGETVFTFELHNESVSTSGLKAIGENRDMPAHIVHPGKGYISSSLKHISVRSASATDAEVLSTVLLLTDPVHAGTILDRFPGCLAIEVEYKDTEPRILELGR